MTDTTGCKKTCWMIGAAAGLVVTAWLLVVSHYGFVAAVFLGLLTFGLFGSFLVWAFSGETSEAANTSGAAPVAPSAPVAASTPIVSPAPSAPAVAEAVPVSAAPAAPISATPTAAASVASEASVTTSAPAAGIAAVPAKAKAAVKAKAPATAKPVATKPAAEPKAAAKAAAKAPAKAAPKPAAKPAAKAPVAAAPVPDAAEVDAPAGTKPKGLKTARKGKADDLKLIEGIGPKLEERLNEWGIFHFDQIAAWGEAEVAFADQNVPRFKGRASRDKWVAQANLIVSEGVEAFLERAKTNDY